MKLTKKRVYAADFETSTGETIEYTNIQESYVWAYGLVDIFDESTLSLGSSIDDFFKKIEKLPNKSVVYFHNLKFDGSFIIWYLLKNEYREVMDAFNLPPFSYSPLVSDSGIWYSIRVRFQNKEVIFLDSYKKLPFTIEKIGETIGSICKGNIDYHKKRYIGAELYAEDADYIKRDVLILARALKQICYDNGLSRTTIGSDCFAYFRKTIKFNQFFPKLAPEVDTFIRKAYKGGYVYVSKKVKNKRLRQSGNVYDYNSMYPSVMHSNSGYLYPVGEPVYYKGDYEQDDIYNLYVQHFRASFTLKPGHVPVVQIKDSVYYEETEYLTEGFDTELYMTNVDLELFFKHYDVEMFDPIDGYKMTGLGGLFDNYIDHWYKFKEEATIKKDAVGRLLAKLMLNNLYGKFGQSDNANKKSFKGGMYKLEATTVEDKRKTVYVPVAAFVTAYARKELITAIQENYDTFCYCDTDSLHLTGEAKGIKIHDSKLGYWKHENEFTDAKFIRAKTYCELIDEKWHFTCAGLPNEVKKTLTVEKFKPGAVFGGKLMLKQVVGGVILEKCDFTIKK